MYTLTIKFSEAAHRKVLDLSRNSHWSILQLVRLGLGLVRLVHEQQKKGNKVLLTTKTGRVLREIVPI